MGEVLPLFKNISPQEEIFCQFYVVSIDPILSGFHANFLDLKAEKKEFDNLDSDDIKAIEKISDKALKMPNIKARISEISKYEAEKHSTAGLKEVLIFLTDVIRTSRQRKRDMVLLDKALKACDMLLKRFPDNESANKDLLKFSRGV